MTAFLKDSFQDSNGTTLASHVGEVGATWTLTSTWNNPLAVAVTQNTAFVLGALRNGNGNNGIAVYTASGSPASADHWQRHLWLVKSIPADGSLGITLRTTANGDGCYLLMYSYATAEWKLFYEVAGAFTQIGASVAQTLTVNQIYEVYFSVTGTTLLVQVDGVTKFSTPDSNVSANGKAGLWFNAISATGSATTGIHILQLTGDSGAEIALESMGDSVTVGANASPQATKRWPYLLGIAQTWNDYTRAQAATQIIDQCSDDRSPRNNQVYNRPVATTDRYCWLTGLNDYRYNGSNANALETFKRTLRSAFAWQSRVAAAKYEANDAIWTYTGSWSALAVNGLNTKYTSTSGDKVTGSVSGRYVTVAYLSRFGLADGGTFTVKADGVTLGTPIDTSFGTASGFTTGGNAARWAPMAIRFDTGSSGSHSIEISLTSASATIGQLAFVVGSGDAAGGIIYAADPTKLADYTAGSPYNNGNDASALLYANAIDDLIKELTDDGHIAYRCGTNSFYLTASDIDTDLVHPVNNGHQHINDAIYATINQGSIRSRARR